MQASSRNAKKKKQGSFRRIFYEYCVYYLTAVHNTGPHKYDYTFRKKKKKSFRNARLMRTYVHTIIE